MNSKVLLFVIVQCLLAPLAFAQGTRAPEKPVPVPAVPDYRVSVTGYFDAEMLAEFGNRVRGYVELRSSLETGSSTLRVTIDPDEIIRAEKVLGGKIRAARSKARQGDIFARPLADQIGKMLVVEVDAQTLAVIMDDNPGEFGFQLNGAYPKDKPVSTVPANLLRLMPMLADGVEYRFVGRHLILRDTKANIIIDKIPYVLRCDDCRGSQAWGR